MPSPTPINWPKVPSAHLEKVSLFFRWGFGVRLSFFIIVVGKDAFSYSKEQLVSLYSANRLVWICFLWKKFVLLILIL